MIPTEWFLVFSINEWSLFLPLQNIYLAEYKMSHMCVICNWYFLTSILQGSLIISKIIINNSFNCTGENIIK